MGVEIMTPESRRLWREAGIFFVVFILLALFLAALHTIETALEDFKLRELF